MSTMINKVFPTNYVEVLNSPSQYEIREEGMSELLIVL